MLMCCISLHPNKEAKPNILLPLSDAQKGRNVGDAVVARLFSPFFALFAFGVLMLRAPFAWGGSEPTLLIPSDSSFYLTAIVESAE